MTDDNQPIFTLTIGELRQEISRLIKLGQMVSQKGSQESKDSEDIIYASEAAKLTGYTRKTLYTKHSRGEIPSLSGGTPLTFSRKQLIAWIEAGRPSLIEMKVKDFMKNNKREL